MKVFVSWSGSQSKHVANLLRTWLGQVIQAVEPWMSSEDIGKGARWSEEIASRLDDSEFGILCVTHENAQSPWLNFEAGALSKRFHDATRVAPLLVDLEPSDVTGPIAQFQASRPIKEDMKRLVHAINGAMGDEALTEPQLETSFEMWWPTMEAGLASLPEAEPHAPRRSEREMIEELLDIARRQDRSRSSSSSFAVGTGPPNIEWDTVVREGEVGIMVTSNTRDAPLNITYDNGSGRLGLVQVPPRTTGFFVDGRDLL